MFNIIKFFKDKKKCKEISNKYEKIEGLKLLVISDIHRSLNDNQRLVLDNYRSKVDGLITLGDIPIEGLREINCDFGVLGNHDYFGGIEKEKDLHLKKKYINNVSFCGFQGSSRYKAGPFVMYSHNESIELLSTLEPCDIFISHDSCVSSYFKNNLDIEDAHSGLLGIDTYLMNKKPLLHLHGHHHKNTVKEKYGIISICVYGIVYIEIKNGEIYLENI